MLKKYRTNTTAVISAALWVSACATPVATDPISAESTPLKIYAGIGAGLSRLNPNDTQASADVNNRVNPGGQITAGMDVNKHLSVELHVADLGSAGFSPNGEISYQMYGISSLLYIGSNRTRVKRQGLTAYGRLGVSSMKNKASEGIVFRNEHASSLLVGAGVEYATRVGLGLRGELILFDEDAVLGQLGLIYRFGGNGNSRQQPVELAQTPVSKPAAIVTPVAAIAVMKPDDDQDGVANTIDECADTIPDGVVDPKGCLLFGGVLEGVNFVSNSDALTQHARLQLNDIAHTLLEYPSTQVIISAHTDSRGSADYNLDLSQRRLESVIDYLAIRGVSPERSVAKAYGETMPIASNDTSDGRKRNRRVEIYADKSARENAK